MSLAQIAEKNNIGITPKQKAFLTFIHQFSQEKGYAPSQHEIANHFGWRSLGTVQDYLKILAHKGVLGKRSNFPRTLEINSAIAKWMLYQKHICHIPIIGKIVAGKPFEAVTESDISTVAMPSHMLPSGDCYALEVSGTSMVEDGIFPGDYIIVKRQEEAEDGNTVIVLLGNEATVKKIYRHNGMIELRPANCEMQSLWIRECKIWGIVVSLYRSYLWK